MATDPTQQLQLFNMAIDLLGGPRSAARAIGVSERTMLRLGAGDTALHDGFLRDVSAALVVHAKACSEIEKKLNPLFTGNLVDEQPRADGRYRKGSN